MGNTPSDFDHEERARQLSGNEGSGNLGSFLAAANFGENPLTMPLVPKSDEETMKQEKEKPTENLTPKSENKIKKDVENSVLKEISESILIDIPKLESKIQFDLSDTTKTPPSKTEETCELIFEDDIIPNESKPVGSLNDEIIAADNRTSAAPKKSISNYNSTDVTPMQSSGIKSRCLRCIGCFS
eukprot:CAMPEP_0197824376 /NCGR_PEP_ID=MMETSP1437-20131217/1634_1 /TAXON_ID=49252 ORGANISM="Eucampia antarctica, Strain CCMP1452" /NCGR_SAMPLE_ID=MMETSP1437 /ASSEMBLY_ACC=CAM_ASM_001096 /LENGTH=184 /DNA_ID=CAMNT_0043423979 /DNA_START=52 /DNA_END=606 /DNA_ORIENTATION=+